MPRVCIRWDEVWIGAALTSLLFTIGKFLITHHCLERRDVIPMRSSIVREDFAGVVS